MRKFKLLLTVVVLATSSITNVHARAVGDRFTTGGVTYEIYALSPELEVQIVDCTLTGNVTFPGTVNDSTMTPFKVTYMKNGQRFTSKGSITSITFSENFKGVGSWAFHQMSSVTTINFPKSFEKIDDNVTAFNDMRKLTTITVASGNPNFKVGADGCLYSYDGTVLYCHPAGKTETTFSIPAGVTKVSCAFRINPNLTTISVPASVTEWAPGSSYGCGNLTTINVATGNATFSSVNGMLYSKDGKTLYVYPSGKTQTTVTLDASIKTLAPYAFCSATKINHLLLPGVETIGEYAFQSCSGMEDITLYPPCQTVERAILNSIGSRFKRFIMSGNSNYLDVDADGVLYTKNYEKLLFYPVGRAGSYTTHANTKIIGAESFDICGGLTQITITNNVEEIERNAFGMTGITAVAFQRTSKLKTIGLYAFHDCHNLETITLPASIEILNTVAFQNCSALKSVYLESGSNLKSVGWGTFNNCTNLETFEFLGTHVADSLSIGDRAFVNCPKLRGNSEGTFFFPAAVWHIGESAFNGCSSLTSVTFQQTSTKQPKLENIGFAAFQNSGLLSITLPRSVKRVGNEAFNSCHQLKTVSIPAATTYVGPQAFLFCSGLTEILVDKNNTVYSSVDGMLASKNKEILYTFPAGKAATYYTMLSPSFTTINDSAFYYNRQLKSVTLPKYINRIGAHAFALCPNLERINILAENFINDVHPEAFIDMERNSRLKDIHLYIRAGHGHGSYLSHSVWGGTNGVKAANIHNAFTAASADLGRVEFFPMSPTDASIVAVGSSATSEDMTTFVVPQTATNTADNKTYSVKLIGDYAFEGSDSNIDEVVVPKGVQLNYIGARAFVKGNSSPAIKSIFLVNSTPADLATSAFGLHDTGVTGNYDEVGDGQKIYVKKSAENTFKAAWPTMADKIGYQIPLPQASAFSTFAREFDADFAEYSENNTSTVKPGWPKVVAFTAGEYRTDGTDENGDPMNYIIMKSINADATGAVGTEGDGTYIPAGTGVLLKSIDGSGSAADFFYQIYDDDVKTPLSPYGDENLLRGITVSTKEVQPTEDGKTNFIVSGNQLHKMTFARYIPVHKSYLQVPTSMIPTATGAKMMFFFKGLDDRTTAIDNSQLATDSSGSEAVYDLQGRKVTSPAKGIYVRNGKKVIIK